MKAKIKTGLRMYLLVPYNIMPIQKGIQAGHCAEQYARKYSLTSQWRTYVENHKTWIILNGGTTNNSNDLSRRGSLNLILDKLFASNINHAAFHEPDLNDALSAICFLADEKVWDFETYPVFNDWLVDNPGQSAVKIMEYRDFIGGRKNEIIRDIIYKRPLAI